MVTLNRMALLHVTCQISQFGNRKFKLHQLEEDQIYGMYLVWRGEKYVTKGVIVHRLEYYIDSTCIWCIFLPRLEASSGTF